MKSQRFGCQINKYAQSAIQRAKSASCKQELANVTCRIDEMTLYPKQLPRYCSGKCYKSSGTGHSGGGIAGVWGVGGASGHKCRKNMPKLNMYLLAETQPRQFEFTIIFILNYILYIFKVGKTLL